MSKGIENLKNAYLKRSDSIAGIIESDPTGISGF